MEKTKFGAKGLVIPMPISLVGANVNGKPNYLAVAYVSMANYDPAMIMVSLGKSHYTNPGIKRNKSFSVNFPSAKLVKATDFCGLHSGKKVDKSEVFKTFYGELKTAPMIEECPVCIEAKLVKTIHFDVDEIFIGKIVQVYVDQKCVKARKLDLHAINPMVFNPTDRCYYKVGSKIGQAWSIGKDYKSEKKTKR